MRQFLVAIAAYRKAIDMAPARAEIYVELAETYEALGEFACAVPAYEQVIRLRPERASTYRSAAQCVLKLAETVSPTSKQARDLHKLAGMYWLALGRLQLKERDDGAEAGFREAAALDPKSGDAFFVLGEFLAAKNRASEAEKPLRRAVSLDPFPYNGTTNTCEALWMGVPVISLIGDCHAGRVGFDLLSQIEMTAWARPDVDSYIETAVMLAGDLPRLGALRRELREHMRASPLCNGALRARLRPGAARDVAAMVPRRA